MAKGTPLMESGYDGVFRSLTKEEQAELIRKSRLGKNGKDKPVK